MSQRLNQDTLDQSIKPSKCPNRTYNACITSHCRTSYWAFSATNGNSFHWKIGYDISLTFVSFSSSKILPCLIMVCWNLLWCISLTFMQSFWRICILICLTVSMILLFFAYVVDCKHRFWVQNSLFTVRKWAFFRWCLLSGQQEFRILYSLCLFPVSFCQCLFPCNTNLILHILSSCSNIP